VLPIPTVTIARTELTEATASVTLTVDTSNLPFDADKARHLVVRVNAETAFAPSSVLLRLNSDSGSNYNTQRLTGEGASPSAGRASGGTSFGGASSVSTVLFGSSETLLVDAFSTRTHKSFIVFSGANEESLSLTAGRWANTAAITSVTISSNNGNFSIGSTFELAVVDEQFAIAGAEQILTEDGTFTVSGIPQLAGDVLLIGNLRGSAAAAEVALKQTINADDTGGNYARQRLRGSGSTASSLSDSDRRVAPMPADNADANAFGAFVSMTSNFAEAVNDPSTLTLSGYHGSSSLSKVQVNSQRRNNVEAVSTIEVVPDSGSWLTNSMLSAYHVPKNIIAMKRLESDAASVTLTIPDGYKHFKLSGYVQGTVAAALAGLNIQINSDSTAANYDRQQLRGDGSSVGASQSAASQEMAEIPAASATNVFGAFSTTFFNYTKTDRHKHFLTQYGAGEDVTGLMSMRWESTSAITQIVLTPSSGSFAAGSVFTVEGIGKESLTWEEDEPIDIDSKVLVDWDNDGKYDGTYDDISSDVPRAQFRGGRDVANALTGQVKAARCTLTVANDDDRYSPFNTSSVLTGNLVPKRPVKIKTEAPVERDLFTGHIERIEPSVDQSRRKIAKITCLGVFGQLTQNEVNIAYQASIGSGAAVDDILDAAGWASGDRDIDTGTQTFKNWEVDSINAMTALRRAEASESGLLVETKSGKIAFEGRDHRFSLPHIVAQSEYSDDPTAKGVLRYENIRELDPLRFIFNDIRATVRKKATNAGVTLWTHSEANTTGDAPSIEPGESVTYWARYPNPASRTDGVGVSSWTALVATTDYTANSASDGTGTDHTADLTIVETDFSKSKKIEITNDASVTVYLTSLKNRGTEVYELDPVSVQAEDASSQTAYGQRTFTRSDEAVWIPDTLSAQEWADFTLSLYKDPSPMIGLTITGQKNLYHAIDVLTRTISDRVGVEADGNAGLGVNEDFYVENWSYEIVPKKVTAHFELSSAAAFSDYWVLGYSLLGSETRLSPA
jgi:hypothetical protein